MWSPSPFYPTHTFAVLYPAAVHRYERENQPTDCTGFVFHESTEAVYEGEKKPPVFTRPLRVSSVLWRVPRYASSKLVVGKKQLKSGEFHDFDLIARRL